MQDDPHAPLEAAYRRWHAARACLETVKVRLTEAERAYGHASPQVAAIRGEVQRCERELELLIDDALDKFMAFPLPPDDVHGAT